MAGPLFPPNPGLTPQPTTPRGVPVGGQDQVIVDIPRRVDPRELRRAGVPDTEIFDEADAQRADVYSEVYDDAEIERAMAESQARYGTAATAAPFDPEAYERAQAEAGLSPEAPAQDATNAAYDDNVDTELSPQERTDLRNAITVGKRRGEVDVLGHVIHVETLNALDEMNVGRYVKPYMDSPGFVRAWTVATVAAGIRAVNGKRIYDSLAPVEDEAELFDQKVRIVARHYPFLITPVYDRINELDAEFAELAERLGKRHG